MMRYRGTDDVQVRFGHFSESRILQSGPEDRVVPYKGERGEPGIWGGRSAENGGNEVEEERREEIGGGG
jgi:hypothetical protein